MYYMYFCLCVYGCNHLFLCSLPTGELSKHHWHDPWRSSEGASVCPGSHVPSCVWWIWSISSPFHGRGWELHVLAWRRRLAREGPIIVLVCLNPFNSCAYKKCHNASSSSLTIYNFVSYTTIMSLLCICRYTCVSLQICASLCHVYHLLHSCWYSSLIKVVAKNVRARRVHVTVTKNTYDVIIALVFVLKNSGLEYGRVAMSMSSFSGLAGVFSSSNETDKQLFMASEVQRRIHELLSVVVPEIFTHPANIPDETVLEGRLKRPLDTIWRAQVVTALLQESTSSSNYCGKVFKNGEPCIFCK